jgi:hypothetical protein
MKDLLRVALLLALAVACAAETGCRPRTKVGTDKPITKVEYFRAKQANTTTTHGKIVLESVKETKDGVEYKTEDGKRWRIKMEPTEGNNYRFGEPKPAE